MDFGRWRRTLAVVRPGQVVKWLCWMALSRVDGTGEKRLAWMKWSKSLVVLDTVATLACNTVRGVLETVTAWACRGKIGDWDEGSWIFQRPLLSRGPEKRGLFSRVMVTWVLVKMASHPLSQS